MSKPSAADKILNSRTAADKAAIARHATAIYTRLPNKLPLTDQNVNGNVSIAQQAIDLAEFFHDQLAARGYDGGDR